MTDLFREIEEELKKDRAVQLWAKYGRYVIAVAVAIVLAVGAYQLWSQWDLSRREARSESFVEATELAEPDREAALAQLAELGAPDGGYGTLATFERARLLAEDGDNAAAIAIWDELAAADAAGQSFQSLATVLSVMHQIDDGDPTALGARLDPLTRVGNGFRPVALELSAVLALRRGERSRARDLYTMIVDDLSAPSGLRARATQMISALKP